MNRGAPRVPRGATERWGAWGALGAPHLTQYARRGSVAVRTRTKYSLKRSVSSAVTMSETRKQTRSPCLHTHVAKPASWSRTGRQFPTLTRARSGSLKAGRGQGHVGEEVAGVVAVVQGHPALALEIDGLRVHEPERVVAGEHAGEGDARLLGEPRGARGHDGGAAGPPHDGTAVLAHHRARQALQGIGAVAGRQHREQEEEHDGRGGQRGQGRGHPRRRAGARARRARMVARRWSGAAWRGSSLREPPAEGLVGEVVRIAHRLR